MLECNNISMRIEQSDYGFDFLIRAIYNGCDLSMHNIKLTLSRQLNSIINVPFVNIRSKDNRLRTYIQSTTAFPTTFLINVKKPEKDSEFFNIVYSYGSARTNNDFIRILKYIVPNGKK